MDFDETLAMAERREDLIEKVAKAIRIKYGQVEIRFQAHIDNSPWETMPKHRKLKWLAMAEMAIDTISEEAP